MPVDDYPTDEEIERIKTWTPMPGSDAEQYAIDCDALMDYVGTIWIKTYGRWEVTEDRYIMATGGWSGNEEIISELKRLYSGVFWMTRWIMSRRGGYYEFQRGVDYVR